MVKILELIRKWAWLILAFCVVGLLALIYQSCTVDATAEYYKGKYAAEMELRAAENDINLVEIERLNNIIIVKDKEITEKSNLLVARYETICTLVTENTRLKQIEPAYPELESHPLVLNLRAQISSLEMVVAEFTLRDSDHESRYFNLTEKYNAQVGISDSYRAMYENEKELHRLAIDRLKIADRRIASLRFTGNAKNVLVVVAGGAIAYLLLK